MGGTNAHVIVEQPPERPWTPHPESTHQLILSARTPDAVRAAARGLAAHLTDHPELALGDVAYTLRAGRCAFGYRTQVSAATLSQACQALDGELRIERAVRGDADQDAVTGAGRRVPLPGYPFGGDRYWVDPP
jgi:acyl transferase domain-containing protein